MKILFVSLGCDKNRVDTEVMLGMLMQSGHSIGRTVGLLKQSHKLTTHYTAGSIAAGSLTRGLVGDTEVAVTLPDVLSS